MPNFFTKARNVELSILYYLENEISSSWSGVTFVKTFTKAYEKDLPVICVHKLDSDISRLEIGTNTLYEEYGISIDIFATSDGQRIDLAHSVIDTLKDGCTYYLHSNNADDPSTLDRTADGEIRIAAFLEDRKVDIALNETHEADKYRQYILVRAVKM